MAEGSDVVFWQPRLVLSTKSGKRGEIFLDKGPRPNKNEHFTTEYLYRHVYYVKIRVLNVYT